MNLYEVVTPVLATQLQGITDTRNVILCHNQEITASIIPCSQQGIIVFNRNKNFCKGTQILKITTRAKSTLLRCCCESSLVFVVCL